jgi:hypothetical protein
LNTTLTPHSIIHGDACFAYFNKIWGIPLAGGYTGENSRYFSCGRSVSSRRSRRARNSLTADQAAEDDRAVATPVAETP